MKWPGDLPIRRAGEENAINEGNNSMSNSAEAPPPHTLQVRHGGLQHRSLFQLFFLT